MRHIDCLLLTDSVDPVDGYETYQMMGDSR